jgi:phosphoesterase RecJ-like protein
MAALHRAAAAAGKKATMLLGDDIPGRYAFLFPAAKPAAASRIVPLADQADAIVVLDTCSSAQVESLAEPLAERADKVIVIDHHATVGDVGGLRWVDTAAAATGVMVGELLDALGWPIDPVTAEALLAATATDTGWLRFANTDARCLRAAARWLKAGVRTDVVYRKIYQTDRPQRLKLMSRLLDGLELYCEGRLAVMAARAEDFAATEARGDETENMINEALRIGTVEVALMVIESADCVRVSLRSRELVDVAALAEGFGGGGHSRAAGVRLAEPVDVAKDRMIHACSAAIAASGR